MGMMGMGRNAPSLFGNNAGCAGGGRGGSLFGGRDGNLFGGRDDHGIFGHHSDPVPPVVAPVVPPVLGAGEHCNDLQNAGQHGDHHGSDDHGSGHHGEDHADGAQSGTGFPAIPADTSGVTFYIDLNGDGTTDKTMSLPANNGVTASGGQSLQNYYDKIVKDLAVSDPGMDPSKVVIKVTAYSPSQGELNFHLTGHDSQSGGQSDDHDHRGHDDHLGDHAQNDHAGNDHAGNDHADNDHAGDDHSGHDNGGDDHAGHGSSDCGNGAHHDDADFYAHLSSPAAGSHDDTSHDHEDGDHHDAGHDLMFC
jgi:hypothetical protein